MNQRTLLTLTIAVFITALIWIAFESWKSRQKVYVDDPVSTEVPPPLKFDEKLFEIIEGKR